MHVERKELRRFGGLTGTVIPLLFGAVFPWLFGYNPPLWPWVLGGMLLLGALVFPAGLRPVYRGWMALGHVLGWVNTRVVLGFAFIAIILPTAMVMRLCRRDPMARTLEKDRPTYRIPSSNPSRNHFERPF